MGSGFKGFGVRGPQPQKPRANQASTIQPVDTGPEHKLKSEEQGGLLVHWKALDVALVEGLVCSTFCVMQVSMPFWPGPYLATGLPSCLQPGALHLGRGKVFSLELDATSVEDLGSLYLSICLP